MCCLHSTAAGRTPLLARYTISPGTPDHSPVVMACWKGKDETLPVIVLNSHYDVVPVAPSDWTVPAFDGWRANGNVYGRGAQDMKCVCVQYVEAIRKFNKQVVLRFVTNSFCLSYFMGICINDRALRSRRIVPKAKILCNLCNIESNVLSHSSLDRKSVV